MTGSNHAVTGAIIAATLPQPAVAVPLALVSHFVLDALPHYGDNTGRSWFGRRFEMILLIDAILCSTFLLSILIVQPMHWLLIIICALVAVAPDLQWLPYYLADKRGETKHDTRYAKLFKWIQWGERPWGIYIEIVWLVASLALFVAIVR